MPIDRNRIDCRIIGIRSKFHISLSLINCTKKSLKLFKWNLCHKTGFIYFIFLLVLLLNQFGTHCILIFLCNFRCHRPRDSLFSWNSGFDNFTGFINWAFLLLSIGGFRLFLENFIKWVKQFKIHQIVVLSHFLKFRYGIRVDPIQWVYILINQESSDWPTLMLMLCKDLFYSLLRYS